MNNIRFDLVMHWLYAIVWALLAISGFSMVSAKYGWLVNFNYARADYIHRVGAAAFVIVTFISIVYEIIRKFNKDDKKSPWLIIGKSGFQLFTFIITLVLIVTGAIIWICIEFSMKSVAFALLVHEYTSFLAVASVIWHIYKKVHILTWPKKQQGKNVKK